MAQSIISQPATPVVSAIISNSGVTVENFPSTQNVNLANVATPPTVQNVKIVDAATPLLVDNPVGQVLDVALHSTPISYVYQGSPFNVNVLSTPYVYVINQSSSSANVTVTNFPATQNVSVVNAATPLGVTVYNNNTPINVLLPFDQSIWITAVTTPIYTLPAPASTPVIYAQITNPLTNVSVSNFPATQNVNVVNAATPLFVDNAPGQTVDVRVLATPYVYVVNQSSSSANVTVTNFPATQNVSIINAATPLLIANPIGQSLGVHETGTPVVYAQIVNQQGAGSSVTVTNFPATQNVSLTSQTTPVITQIYSTPIVYAQITSIPLTYPVLSKPITVFSSAPGTNATPLCLAAGGNIITKSYVFTTSGAATCAFMATPSPLILANPQMAGIPQALKDSAIVGGPFYVAQNGGVSFAGDVDGHALQVGAGTPLYFVSIGANVGGHITYLIA